LKKVSSSAAYLRTKAIVVALLSGLGVGTRPGLPGDPPYYMILRLKKLRL
jgi:hypothetical protein